MNKIFSIVLICFVLSACSTQQDPLSNAPDVVKQGTPPVDYSEDSIEKPIAKDALQIDVPNLINGQVNSSIEFKIQGRVLVPDVQFQLKIDNLAAFPGAVFDEATGEFKWIPKPEVMGKNFYTQFSLIISLTTLPGKTNIPISIEKKTIILNIVDAFGKPTVTSVQANASYETGFAYNLNIDLFDDRAETKNDFSLIFNQCNSSSYLPINQVITYNQNNFRVDLPKSKLSGFINLNLRANPFTYVSTSDYCFSVVTVSKFGILSAPYEVKIKMKVPTSPTKSTLTNLNIKKGESKTFNFSFFDPYQKGHLSILSNDVPETILPGSTIQCLNSLDFQIDCVLFVSAAAVEVGSFDLKFSIANSISNFQTVQTDHKITIHVTEPL